MSYKHRVIVIIPTYIEAKFIQQSLMDLPSESLLMVQVVIEFL